MNFPIQRDANTTKHDPFELQAFEAQEYIRWLGLLVLFRKPPVQALLNISPAGSPRLPPSRHHQTTSSFDKSYRHRRLKRENSRVRALIAKSIQAEFE